MVIPSWDGGALLARHLPEVAAQARALAGGAEVVVADDGSRSPDDTTAAVVRLAGEPVRLLRLGAHGGFGAACNAGAAEARGDVLVFLNNDVHPEPGYLEALVAALEGDERAFAVAPVTVNAGEGFVESTTRLRFHRGVFDALFPGRDGLAPPAPGERRPIAFACGGAFACRRAAFLALGGFSPSYVPFYWEDVDLGWRARRAGLEIYEIGSARARHEHAATIGARYPRRAVRLAYERNRLLFTWTHLAGARAWAAHLARLPLRFAAALFRADAAAALPRALAALPAVVRERRRLRSSGPRAAAMLREVTAGGERGWPPAPGNVRPPALD